MKKVILFLLPIILFFSCEEKCDCSHDFDFVKKYVEDNLPGFADNVNESNLLEYENFKKEASKMAANAADEHECLKALTFYVEFFKDNHTSIQSKTTPLDVNDEQAVADFLKSDKFTKREKVEIPQNLEKEYPLDEVEGIYHTLDSSYTILVMPNKNDFRDYVGVILNSRTPLWERGQVKFELKKRDRFSFEAFSYSRSHILNYNHNFTFRNGILGDYFYKSNQKEKINHSINFSWDIDFQVLQDSFAYLRIPTFAGEYTAILDSAYQEHFPKIKQLPYLIIDIRNNGGGSDTNVKPLLPLIYNQPIIDSEVIDLYVTEENIKRFEEFQAEMLADTINFSKEDIEWSANEISKMKNTKMGTFLSRGEYSDTIQFDEILENPRKVAILYNKGCASSCETILFLAPKHSKAILVGENSGGYVGYGEVLPVETPRYKFDHYQTVTRYRQQRKFEVVGVTPDHQLDYSKDWVEQTIDILKK